MPSALIGDQTIFYEDTGGSKPVLVFSHGFLMDRTMFDANVAALRDDYRCVTWDQRGHGRTGPAQEPFDYWDSAHDLLGLLDRLEIPLATLIGMSQGGFISLRAALLAPQRVERLVLIDTRSDVDAPDVLDAFRALDAEWRSNGAANVKHDLAGLLGLGATAAAWFEKWDRIGNDDLALSIRALVERDDITACLPDIRQPAIVIHGEADVAIDPVHGRALAQALPECRGIFFIPGGGHAPNMTHPELTNAVLQRFLAGQAV
jgi:pimeloyl-ACP methyl ester carboxylesterase